ncbi:ARMH3 family protein [Aspergillus stella-maris]|uniref:ARMH3 family protein n=1 Tax=Aspergillus stella-maris TaxID=1810926 RepID=UPI003CCC92EA
MSTVMESPLTQQSRPEIFKPKVVQLYENLFQIQDYVEPSEGFWRELFLLPPDRAQLNSILEALTPDETLNLQVQTQQLFSRAIREASSGTIPTDSYALETLTVFLACILKKKYTNPSSDVITVLAGLDRVDLVISNFVAVLDGIIRGGSNNEIRFKAIRTAIAMTSGAYKTSLVSYFTHRDLFPSIMKLVHESESPMQVFEPFLLLGLLANYNKFEFQNPYQLRLDDFVNETSIQKIVKGVGTSCGALRNGYVAVQDDSPEGWTLMGTLMYFGLGVLSPNKKEKPRAPSLEEAKEMFAALPAQQAAILLATYDFTNANKLFGYHLINTAAEKDTEESPFSSFLSLTSYLLHHAYRSPRVGHYAELSLFILRILSEDSTSCKLLCSDESKRKVRICRQRQPYLPVVTGDRVLATAIFDILIDAISHNLRRRLDVQLYSHTIAILLRILTYLSMNRIRLTYHWSELWRNLLSLMRFLTSYVSDLQTSPHITTLTTSLVDLVAFCVSAGDTFLPDPASYDDLFYKLVETGPIIAKFRDVYSLRSSSFSSSTLAKGAAGADSNKDIHVAAVETLISVSTHFYALLFNPGSGTATTDAEKPAAADGDTQSQAQTPTPIPAAQKKNLGPREVHRIIKQGYDTLSIQPPEGLSAWTRYRESDWKPELKRAARGAVEDATLLVA